MHPQSTLSPQFVRICACGCGQPTMIARQTRSDRGEVGGQPRAYLGGHRRRGRRTPRYRGVKRHGGYILRHVPDHPSADKRGYVPEHRLIAETTLGRLLACDEVVHHINRVKDDNRPENLQVLTHVEHMHLHHSENPGYTRRAPRWSLRYAACIECGKTEHRHAAHGRCSECHYRAVRKHDPTRWSRLFDACIECGNTERPHAAHGLCDRCTNRAKARVRAARHKHVA